MHREKYQYYNIDKTEHCIHDFFTSDDPVITQTTIAPSTTATTLTTLVITEPEQNKVTTIPKVETTETTVDETSTAPAIPTTLQPSEKIEVEFTIEFAIEADYNAMITSYWQKQEFIADVKTQVRNVKVG